MKINFNKIIILISIILLSSCDPISEKKQEIELKVPRDQYGTKYSIGNLGGKPVQLGSGVFWLEYEDNAGFVPGRKYKRKVRNYDSKIVSFGFYMRYTDGLLYVLNYKAPRYSKDQYEKEIRIPGNQWISVGVNSHKNYYGDLTTRLKNLTLDLTISYKEYMEELNYSDIYMPTEEYVYELQKYNPHPVWAKTMLERSKKSLDEYKYLHDIRDLYVNKDKNNKVLTLIRCENSKYAISEKCNLEYVLEPEMKVRLNIIFQRVHLKDWKLIQNQAEKVVKSFVVKANNSKGE